MVAALVLNLLSLSSVKAQILPELATCNGFSREWGVCPSLPRCSQPTHCQFADWDEWYYGGGCTGICFRNRQVKEYSDDLGRACRGPLATTKDCTSHKSYVSSCFNGATRGFLFGESTCEWQQWSEWSDCSRECGGGEKSRDRQIAKTPEYGGAPCNPVDTEEVVPCNEQPCMECIDGQWAPWQPWQACSVSCGSGMQWRQRDYAVQANQCGRPATGSHREFRPCHGGFSEDDSRCPKQVSLERCMLGDWDEWGSCEAQCDIGRRARRRAFYMSDVDHYTADLEDQVFKAQTATEKMEQEENALLLDITDLERKTSMLEDDGKNTRDSLGKEFALNAVLQANVSRSKWLLDELQTTVNQLRQDNAQLQHKADEMALSLQKEGLPTPRPYKPKAPEPVSNEQAGTIPSSAFLVFAAAFGATCACAGSGFWQRFTLRRQQRGANDLTRNEFDSSRYSEDSKYSQDRWNRPGAAAAE